MLIVKSQRNKDQIIDDHKFIYERKRSSRQFIVWRCIVNTCKSTAHSEHDYATNLRPFTNFKPHNHLPDLDLAIKKTPN